MAVTYRKSSRTIRGITYKPGDPFVCYAANSGASSSEGSGTASALTKGTTHYYLGYAWDDDNNKLASYPYAVSTSSTGSVRGWYRENVFPYATYTIAYNANGGTGAPNSQVKTHGENLKLSTGIPKKDGYAFAGWALTKSDADSGKWYYQPGNTCGKNENLTLYAVWEKTEYTITYNANGGTLGAVKTQTKEHGKDLTLTGTATRTNYDLLGWSISSSATEATYSVGGKYTENKSATLYAVWGTSYQKPRITNVTVCRAVRNEDATYTESETGNFLKATFTWACDGTNPTVITARKTVSDTDWITTNELSIAASGSSWVGFGYETENGVRVGKIDPEKSYDVKIIIKDSGGSNEKQVTVTSVEFPIDALPKKSDNEKSGVAFGKVAELPGVAEFAYEGKFNSPVYGKALGMDRLPAIPSNSDLNNYMETGCYAVQSNAIAESCKHIPVARAGRLEVWSATGEGVRAEGYSYLRQRYIPYNNENAVWERDIARNDKNVWTYYDWWRSSLTPEVSEKVYSKAAITISMSATTKATTIDAYVKIPFNTIALSTSSRLTMQDNSIRIGANIKYVKVSGQVLSDPDSSLNAQRHARIRKVSNGTTTSISWIAIDTPSGYQTVYPLTPVIVSVNEGDLLHLAFYARSTNDSIAAGSSGNGYQTYLTVEEL